MDPDLKPHMWTDVSYKMASEYFPELAALARLGPAQYVCVIYFPGFQGAQARPHPQAAGPGPGRVRRRASRPLTYLRLTRSDLYTLFLVWRGRGRRLQGVKMSKRQHPNEGFPVKLILKKKSSNVHQKCVYYLQASVWTTT